MLTAQEFERWGDEFKLTNHINTDDIERANWRDVQGGNGFIRENGEVVARVVARIPEDEAAMLRAQQDIDFLAFEYTSDKNALKRLLQRFPHWRCSSGGF